MRSTAGLSFLLIAAIGGCASSRTALGLDTKYQPGFLQDSVDIDEVRVGGKVVLTDPAELEWFKEACSNAKWAPYIATLPADSQTVTFFSNGVEIHSLLYTGSSLLDTTGDAVTFGTIRDSDKPWVLEHIGAGRRRSQ